MSKAELSEFEVKKKKLIKKKKKTRVKRRFIVFLFLLVCISTIFVVLKAPFFNVKTIECIGQTTLSQEEVIKIAGAKTDVNIFSTGVGTMKRRLSEHPVISECNVRRIFPNKIKIWVREAKPVICVEDNGMFLLADKNGSIIKSVDAKTKDAAEGISKLANFKPASVKVGENMFDKADSGHRVILDCIGVLDKLDMIGNVTSIEASDLSDISLQYQDRLSIMLGSYDDMDYKLTFIKKVIDENISKYEKAILDYRGENLYVSPKSEEVMLEDLKADKEDEKDGAAITEGTKEEPEADKITEN